MEKLTKNICLICMRGGSREIPGKNLRQLLDKPLMAYTLEQAKGCGLFEDVVVSTDSEEIAKVSRNYGAKVWFRRPAELASDQADKLPVRQHALLEAEKHFDTEFEVVFDLDVTSPLRDVEDIIRAYHQFIREDADILITACLARRNPYFNMVELIDGSVRLVKQLEKPVVRRQDAPGVYDMNASIYIWKRDALMNGDSLFTDKTSLYIMPEERSIDIDTELDWEIVEYLMDKRLGGVNV